MPSLMNRLGKFSSVVKSKSAVVKEKMINYIKNEQQPTERSVHCVSVQTKVSKRGFVQCKSALISASRSIQPGIEQTLRGHGYRLVYHATCLFTSPAFAV